MGARLVLILALLLASSAWADNVMKCSQQPKLQCASAMDYGAKCDGTTDDSQELQDAIDAMTTNGGVLVIPAGKRCAIGTETANDYVQLKSNVTILCEPGGGFKALASALAILKSTGTGASRISNWQVQGCTFDLNSQSGVPAIDVAEADKFRFAQNSVSGAGSTGSGAFSLVKIYVKSGLSITNSDGVGSITDNYIEGTLNATRADTCITSNGGGNSALGGSPVIADNRLRRCGAAGIRLEQPNGTDSGAIVMGNVIEQFNTDGIYLGSSQNTVTGNKINGASNANGIVVCGEGSDVACGNQLIKANTIVSGGGTARAVVVTLKSAGNISGTLVADNYANGGITFDAKGVCGGGSNNGTVCDTSAVCTGGGTCGTFATFDHIEIAANTIQSGANAGIIFENGEDIIIRHNRDVSQVNAGTNPGCIDLINTDSTADTKYVIDGNDCGATPTSGTVWGLTFDSLSSGVFSSITVNGNTYGSSTSTNGTITGGIRFINSTTCRGCNFDGNEFDGATTSISTAIVSGANHAFGRWGDGQATVAADEERRSCLLQMKRAGTGGGAAGDILADGCGVTTTANAVAANSDADGVYLDLTTSNVNGNAASVTTPEVFAERRHNPIMTCVIETGSDIANVRIHVGLYSAAPTGAASVADMAGFRYDTGADGTAFWRTVTRDAGGTATATATTAAIAVSTRYLLRVDLTDTQTGNVKFYINQALVRTETATLPTSTVALFPYVAITTLTNATKTIRFSKCIVRAE